MSHSKRASHRAPDPCLASNLPGDTTAWYLAGVTATGAGWPALWAPALICSTTTNGLGSELALAAIPRLDCWSHWCPVGWGSPALLTELSLTTHPVGNFLISDPGEVSVESWFFGKAHLGAKHFLNYQHSTVRACGLGDILPAHWGRWHCTSKLYLPSHLQCGKSVITSPLVAKLISIPAMGCECFSTQQAGQAGASIQPQERMFGDLGVYFLFAS